MKKQRQVSVTKIFEFPAMHHLTNHDGKCARPHGHNYKLEVTVTGKVRQADGHPKEGMVIDFSDMKKLVKEHVLDHFDHQNLNEVVDYPTSAENLARDIFERLSGVETRVSRIKLWENSTAFAEVVDS